MNSINGIQPPVGPGPIDPTQAILNANQVLPSAGAADVVEISAAAKLAAKVQQIPEIRTDLVEQIKTEIAAGTYETPERLEIAVDKLAEDLFPGP